MNELSNNKCLMNHVELCELINELRAEEGNRKELRSHTLIAKIDKEVETSKKLGLSTEQNFLFSEYKDKSGKKNRTYLMNRDGILQIAASESVYVRAKIIEYINALENKVVELEEQKRDSYMIEDPIERAYAWIEEEKERKRLEAENKKLLNVIEEQEDTIDSLKAIGISEPYNVQSMCQHLPGKPYPNEVYNKLIELGWLCKTNVATYNVTIKGRNKIYKHGRGICFYIKGWNEFKNCLKSRNKNQ